MCTRDKKHEWVIFQLSGNSLCGRHRNKSPVTERRKLRDFMEVITKNTIPVVIIDKILTSDN